MRPARNAPGRAGNGTGHGCAAYRAGECPRINTPAMVQVSPAIFSAVTGSWSTTMPRTIVITMYRFDSVTTSETGRQFSP